MAMRNYGAMLDAKLLQCIAELRAQSGDAYERVIAKQNAGKPAKESSLLANLAAAEEAKRSRGLMSDGLLAGRRVRPPVLLRADPPVPAFTEPEIDLCRGCAGTGVDRSVHIRTLQMADGAWSIGPKPGAMRATTKVERLGAPTVSGSTRPLAELLTVFAKAAREGREIKHDLNIAFPLTKADACTRCHGTGIPAPE